MTTAPELAQPLAGSGAHRRPAVLLRAYVKFLDGGERAAHNDPAHAPTLVVRSPHPAGSEVDACPTREEDGVTDNESALAAFGYELGVLKRVRRAGWWHAGVRDPESVAEHSVRVAQLAGVLAAEEGATPERAAYLALWHDTQETRTGDLPHTVGDYLTKPDPRRITADQTAALSPRASDTVRDAVDEYETVSSREAICARDADKLEMLLQAVEYADTGIARVDEWLDSARAALTTETARKVAEAAMTISPLAWRQG